ncbi:hypothetical protein PO124_03355 [Bacillus licheniformis]|nr:hypothetical protein [Bacillus licheniformis]
MGSLSPGKEADFIMVKRTASICSLSLMRRGHRPMHAHRKCRFRICRRKAVKRNGRWLMQILKGETKALEARDHILFRSPEGAF